MTTSTASRSPGATACSVVVPPAERSAPVEASCCRTSGPIAPTRAWKERASSYGFQSSLTLPVTINGEIDGAWCIYAPEPNAFDDIAVSTLADLAAELGYGLNRLREQERLVQSLRDQSLLSEAIEQAGESIVVTDPAASIVYANPAAARTSGYALEELIGANPRVLHSGLQDRAFYDEMWATLVAGRTWRGTISNKRKDGSLYEEDATISPIHDADGNLTAYVAVKRDLTTERHLEGSLSREMQDRNAVLEVMREVRRSETIQDTANDFCRAATKFDAIEVACLLLRQSDGELLPIGLSGTDMFDVYKAQSFPSRRPLLHNSGRRRTGAHQRVARRVGSRTPRCTGRPSRRAFAPSSSLRFAGREGWWGSWPSPRDRLRPAWRCVSPISKSLARTRGPCWALRS